MPLSACLILSLSSRLNAKQFDIGHHKSTRHRAPPSRHATAASGGTQALNDIIVDVVESTHRTSVLKKHLLQALLGSLGELNAGHLKDEVL